MCQYLPVSNFRWLSDDKVADFDENFILSLDDKSAEGYIAEVDLEYPNHLHDLHNSYPLAPEKMKVTKTCYRRMHAVLVKNLF